MTSYFLRRLLLMIPTFLGITLIVFAVLNFAPGRPGGALQGADIMKEARGEQCLPSFLWCQRAAQIAARRPIGSQRSAQKGGHCGSARDGIHLLREVEHWRRRTHPARTRRAVHAMLFSWRISYISTVSASADDSAAAFLF